jgi:acyl-coenzyme A synthetase/AMP-(fatty) acid ligase
MNSFWIDPLRKQEKDYSALIRELNQKTTLNKYIYFSDPFEIFVNLIACMLSGSEIHLLDSDFSETEIKNLGISPRELEEKIPIRLDQISDFSDLLQTLEKSRIISRIVIKFAENVWGFAYNPTHFAGVQVFLQAFLNQNVMVNIFELAGRRLLRAFEEHKITNVSATPTFYRKILTDIRTPLPSVLRCTLGGEKYDPQLQGALKKIFPHAVIRNIYASTEAGTLFSSEDEIFKVQEAQKHLIQISPEGELLVHKSLLGGFDSQDIDGEWYHSGDLVEKVGDNQFQFISRKTEMINVGGYKVNPHEVEEEIKKISGIIDVRISARENRLTGNILMAEIVKQDEIDEELMEKRIFEELSDRLQPFKIPRIVRFVAELQLTRTGKKERL